MKYQLYNLFSAFILTMTFSITDTHAQIIYTDVNPDTTIIPLVNTNLSYSLDLNSDGIVDFKIHASFSHPGGLFTTHNIYVETFSNNEIAIESDSFASKLDSNIIISNTLLWLSGTNISLYGGSSNAGGSHSYGHWDSAINRFLGLRINVSGSTYYGWVRLDRISFYGFILKDYAYNSILDQSILAGDNITGQTGLVENIVSSTTRIYPNPSFNLLTIELGNTNKNVEVIICDISGKIIFKTYSNKIQKIELNTTDFAEGIYVVQIQSADFIETNKFIIAK